MLCENQLKAAFNSSVFLIDKNKKFTKRVNKQVVAPLCLPGGTLAHTVKAQQIEAPRAVPITVIKKKSEKFQFSVLSSFGEIFILKVEKTQLLDQASRP